MVPSADAYFPGSQFLEHDWTQLNDAQRSLAPSDDGVDTWTVSVVRTDSAVSVAVQRRCIATGTALSLTGDEVDERLDQCLLGGLGVHASQLHIRPGPPSTPGTWLNTFTGGGTASGSGCFRVCQPKHADSRGQIEKMSVKIAQMGEKVRPTTTRRSTRGQFRTASAARAAAD